MPVRCPAVAKAVKNNNAPSTPNLIIIIIIYFDPHSALFDEHTLLRLVSNDLFCGTVSPPLRRYISRCRLTYLTGIKWKTVPSGSSKPKFGPKRRSGIPTARSAASAATGSGTRNFVVWMAQRLVDLRLKQCQLRAVVADVNE